MKESYSEIKVRQYRYQYNHKDYRTALLFLFIKNSCLVKTISCDHIEPKGRIIEGMITLNYDKEL